MLVGLGSTETVNSNGACLDIWSDGTVPQPKLNYHT